MNTIITSAGFSTLPRTLSPAADPFAPAWRDRAADAVERRGMGGYTGTAAHHNSIALRAATTGVLSALPATNAVDAVAGTVAQAVTKAAPPRGVPR